MNALEERAFLRLHLATLYTSGLGAQLIDHFGSASAVFDRSRDELLAIPGASRRTVARLRDPALEEESAREIDRCRARGVSCLIRGRPDFPPILGGLPDMPLVLFSRGRMRPADACSVGIVGSRRPSGYGLRQAARFAAALAARGVTVVSGLARGIDIEAQRSALASGGRTLAVLGSGLERVYPPEHRRFADEVVESDAGAVVTEFPLRTSPRSFHFPQRNRLLSGLSRVLLVVEAGERSGSLITVRWALDQGKSVFAVPGRVDRQEALGGLRLLRDGAAPALDPEDLLRELGLPLDDGARPGRESSGPRLPGALGRVLSALFDEEDRWPPDALAARLDVPLDRLLAELARLELDGVIARDAAGAYRLAR